MLYKTIITKSFVIRNIVWGKDVMGLRWFFPFSTVFCNILPSLELFPLPASSIPWNNPMALSPLTHGNLQHNSDFIFTDSQKRLSKSPQITRLFYTWLHQFSLTEREDFISTFHQEQYKQTWKLHKNMTCASLREDQSAQLVLCSLTFRTGIFWLV